MSILIALGILIVIWGIVSIIEQKKMDRQEYEMYRNRMAKEKMISELEKEIKKIKGSK